MSKPVQFIRKPREWKNLHPAPRVAVEEKNCCDCIFFKLPVPTIMIGDCSMTGEPTNSYDECGAFTKKEIKE